MFDVFLSYSHADANWVEQLAQRLVDEHSLRVWLDRWILIPGESWQRGMAQGLDQTKTCAVCIGLHTPAGWFREEIERALDLQTKNNEFRVIPVLLPEASTDIDRISAFLPLRTWVDFRNGQDQAYAFHVLVQGIKGLPIGRWPISVKHEDIEATKRYENKLIQLQRWKGLVHEEVLIEAERKIVNRWLEDQG